MNIQFILVILVATGAVFFLGMRFYKVFSRKNKDGNCPNCGMDASVKMTDKKIL